MRNPIMQSGKTFSSNRLWSFVVSVLIVLVASVSQAQTPNPAMPPGAPLTPEPAVSAILAAFDKYEIVGMPEAHDLKDLDDFIFTLIRTPAFPDKVNDIEVECGNSLYQAVLDRYISGEDVPFTEVRKVWRNTTQDMCGSSQFFAEFFPLVRAINRRLPSEKRLRVLAGDPPIDWEQVKNFDDFGKFLMNRDVSIAAVLEKETLSKHRKALMLFGTLHLTHGVYGGGPNAFPPNAVTIFEKDYPGVTFVISELGIFDTNLSAPSDSPFASWVVPALAKIKGTWLGALGLDRVVPAPAGVNPKDCSVIIGFPEDSGLRKPLADLVDAVLYLGQQDLRLAEEIPADVALDADYRTEIARRDRLVGSPFQGLGAPSKENDQRLINRAEKPLFAVPMVPEGAIKVMEQSCLDRKSRSSTPQ